MQSRKLYGFSSWPLLAILFLTICGFTGCSSIGANVDQSKLIVQVVVMKVIEADKDHAHDRAVKVAQIASDAKSFLDTTDTTVVALEAAVNMRIATLNLSPADQILAQAVVAAVVQELAGRVGQGLLSPDQKFTASEVLGWIQDAAALY